MNNVDTISLKIERVKNTLKLNNSISFNNLLPDKNFNLYVISENKIQSLGTYSILKIDADNNIHITPIIWNSSLKQYKPLIYFTKNSKRDFLHKIDKESYLNKNNSNTNDKYFFTEIN